ncbi:MAG: hypothetical protein IJZ36_05335, partial [Bacilli bacterium]|nr:hypothetical protein [Bacilli bacterium]
MGVFDLDNDIDIERARYDRENRLHPPEYPSGQDMDITSSGLFDSGMSDMSYDAPISMNSMGMGDMMSGGANPWASTYGSGYNTGYQQQQPAQQQGFTYEKFESICGKTITGFTQIFKSFSSLTSLFWYNYCFKLFIIGCVCSGVGFILMLFGISRAKLILLSGLLELFSGACGWFALKDNSLNCTSEYKDKPQNNINNIQTPEYNMSMDNLRFNPNLDVEDDPWDEVDVNSESMNETRHMESGLIGEDINENEPEWTLEDSEVEEKEEPMSANEALDSMQSVPQGMYTRQYLYDMFTKVLPKMKPNFSTLTEITPDDDAFHQMAISIREAAEVCGVKGDVELERLQENFSTIICECSRPVGCKPDVVADELARIYAHRSKSDISKVYAKAESVGRKCIITIFTGNTAMISLRDMLMQKEDFFLDASNYIPVVFGIDHKAEVIAYDFKKLESILITGMPRSGKSWFVQAVLTQMCALVPPSELNIYICDPKDGISDFKSFCLPHVKK